MIARTSLTSPLRARTLVVDDGLGLVAADIEEDDALVRHEQRLVLLDLQVVHDALPRVATPVQQAQRGRQNLKLLGRRLRTAASKQSAHPLGKTNISVEIAAKA